MDKRKRICIYCRVSTVDQELEQQIQTCRKYCDYRGFDIAKVYAEKASGGNSQRPQYIQMVRGLRECKYDGVIVVRLDRLGRNARELAMLVDELEGKGIRVLSVKENFDTSTPLGHAMRNHR